SRLSWHYAAGLHSGLEPDVHLMRQAVMLRLADKAAHNNHAVWPTVLACAWLGVTYVWLCFQGLSVAQLVAVMLLLFMLVVLAGIDMRCGLLPDALTLPLLVVGLVAAWLGAG